MRAGLAVFLLLPAGAPAAGPALYLVADRADDKGTVSKRALVRVTFGADGKPDPETIVTLDQRFFGHFGGHRLVDDRYVVTTYGGVIDLSARAVIHDELNGQLLGVDGGKVVYRATDVKRDNAIFAFDLKARTAEQLKDPGHWALPGVKSPDRSQSVYQPSLGGEARVHTPDGKSWELARGLTVTFSPLSSTAGGSPPFLWLDNESILTQEDTGKLVLLTLDGKREPVLTIDKAPGPVGPPRLEHDPDGQVVYVLSRHEWLIDLKSRTAMPLSWRSLGHGFVTAARPDERGYRTVLHDGQPVGRWMFEPSEVRTADGRIALMYWPDRSHRRTGVAVWDKAVGDWRVVEVTPNSLIGWGSK